MFLAPSKSQKRAKILDIGESKTNNYIQIKINMPNPSQEPQASSKTGKHWMFLMVNVQRTSMSFKYSFGALEEAGGS